MAKKQLILVVETTAAMGRYFKSLLSDYLEDIIRNFCNLEVAGQKSQPSETEFALVTFNAHGPYNDFLVQRSRWTTYVDNFFDWLHALRFSGGGFDDAAIAEGLAEALMMVPPPSANQNQQNLDVQRHCILLAASSPYPLPTLVYRPQMPILEHGENTEVQLLGCLADAVTVAKCFSYCPVTLSVISPKQFPKLKEIYNAGKCNPQGTDPPLDSVKSPHHLVLISENFIEARAGLSKSGTANLVANLNPVKMDIALAPSVSVSLPTSSPPGIASIGGLRPLTGTVQVALQNSSNIGMSRPMGPTMNQGNLIGPSMVQSGMGVNQIMMGRGLGQGDGIAAETGSMMPTPAICQPGISQQWMSQHMQSVLQSMCANGNAAAIMALSQQGGGGLQSARSKYVKVWEGSLFVLRKGQPAFITRLEGYRNTSSCESLAADWPPTMLIVKLISEDHYVRKQYVDKTDFLVFRAMKQQRFLEHLQEKKLCAVIQLPSQTLMLSTSGMACRLIGMLFPEDVTAFKPQISSQQQQPQGLAQMQQQSIPQMQQQQ